MQLMNVGQLLQRIEQLDNKNINALPNSNEVNNIINTSDSFSSLLNQAINHVNDSQQIANTARKTAVANPDETNIVDAMIAAQKASVEFEGLLQVRNRLVRAYQDIMNMPI